MIMMMWLPNWTKWYSKKHWHFPMNNNVIEMCGMGKETNKREWKMEWKMMWKMVTVNTLGREILKMEQKCIFHFRHTGKKMKNDRVHLCKSKVRVPFFIQFSFILSFNFEKNRNKMKQKLMEKWVENEQKMPTVNNPIP